MLLALVIGSLVSQTASALTLPTAATSITSGNMIHQMHGRQGRNRIRGPSCYRAYKRGRGWTGIESGVDAFESHVTSTARAECGKVVALTPPEFSAASD